MHKYLTYVNMILEVLAVAIGNIILLMSNPEEYIRSCLNSSVSKFAYAFPKAHRFQTTPNSLPTEAKYTLPSMLGNRSCSFGYGSKVSLADSRCSPPPGAYESQSLFERGGKKRHSPTFGLSRENILFGSYLSQARKRSQHLPSPDRYDIKLPKAHVGGHISIRLQTDPVEKAKALPGPGAYQLKTIDMASASSFGLSKFRRASSPKYHQSKTIDLSEKKTRKAMFYDVEEKVFGKSKVSKFRNVSIAAFGRQKKLATLNKWKLSVPGHKYKIFSEFGNNYH